MIYRVGITRDAKGEVVHRQLALYPLRELAQFLLGLTQVHQFIKIHLEIDPAGDPFQVLDPQEGAEETQLQIGTDLHQDLRISKVANGEIAFKAAFSGAGIHVMHAEF